MLQCFLISLGMGTPADLAQIALAAVMRAGREPGPLQLHCLTAAVAAAQHRSQASKKTNPIQAVVRPLVDRSLS